MIRAACRVAGAFVLLLGQAAAEAGPRVVLETSQGVIEVELEPQKAPRTVANFLKYVDARYYDGTAFHRVIADFMIQAGGYDAHLAARVPDGPIVNESNNGLRNLRGALAMARLNAPDSATAQFFIDVADNPDLDFRPGRAGYAVFGRVTAGMDVVDAIAAVETHSVAGMDDVPRIPVVIVSARRAK